MSWWCTMADKYRDEGLRPRVYCKFLGKVVELQYCQKECTDREPMFETQRKQPDVPEGVGTKKVCPGATTAVLGVSGTGNREK